MNELIAPDASWEHIAPQLDAALGALSEPDRDALLLRYFERKSAQEMAQILSISDEAAQKRVTRAVERLRDFFSKRNVTVGTSGLGVLISANAVQAAPTGLAAAISAAALITGTAFSSATLIAATKTIFMTTLQKTLVTVTVAVLAGAGIYEARQAAQLREQNQTLERAQAPLAAQIAQLKSDNENLSHRVAQANGSPTLSSERLRELLRLRGEVGVLRRQQHELEQAAAAAQSRTSVLAGRPRSGAAASPNNPAPFQMQLVRDDPAEDTESMTNNASGAGEEILHLQKAPLMDCSAISSATVTTDPASSASQINIAFSAVGKELFAAITRENLNKRLAIVLDGHVYSAPLIREEISEGKAQITGSFTEDEARELAAKINDAVGGQ